MHPDELLNSVLADWLPRTDYRALPLLPTLLLEGPTGSGKTDALGRLEARWRDAAPVLRIDLRSLGSAVEPYRVAVAIGEALLGGRAPVSFRALSLGLAVLEIPIGDLDQAVHNLGSYLNKRDRVVAAVTTVVGHAREELPALPFPTPGAGLALAGVPPLAWAVRRRHRSYQWFQTATGAPTPLHGLARLNRWHASGDAAAVNTLLLRAFLQDLRWSFQSWLRQGRTESNIVLLLDDVDVPAGRRFLTALRAARDQDPQESDPLVVVATSGRRSDAAPALPATVVPMLVPTSAEPGEHAERLCRAIADGHHWAMIRLAAVAAEHGDTIQLATLLSDELVADAAARFLAGRPADLQNDLYAAAAVHPWDPSVASVGAALTDPDLPEPVRSTAATNRQAVTEQFVWERLWATRDARHLQPFFRRVLLHRLSRRPAGSRSWEGVFGRLRDAHAQDDGRAPWQVHYRLAGDGDVAAAARALGARLRTPQLLPGWIGDLDIVTAAPQRPAPGAPGTYAARLTALIGAGAGSSDPRDQLITTIVGAGWLSRNLGGAPDLFEYLELASAFDALAMTVDPDLRRPFHLRAERYRDHYRMQKFFEPPGPEHPEEFP